MSWSNLQALYKRGTEQNAGLRLLPKLKYEHVNLTAFLKMKVDLAAQVSSSFSNCIHCQSEFIVYLANIGYELISVQ